MANILIISGNLKDWSKNSGGKERTATLAEALSEHTVTFLSFSWDGPEFSNQITENLLHLQPGIDPATYRTYIRLIRGAAKNNHDAAIQMLKPSLKRFSKQVKDLSKTADLVILDHYSTAPFLEDVEPGVPIIYNSHNAEIVMAHQLYPNDLELIDTVQQMEGTALSKASVVTYCSKQDNQELKDFYDYKAKSFYVPNGAVIISDNNIDARFNSKNIVFVGSGHPPNVVAANNIIPIAQMMPEYKFILCGNASNSINKSIAPSNVIPMGHVSDSELDMLFKTSFAFINPMESGSGTHLKAMKALAYGIPILSSTVGARGFSDDEIKQSMIIADTAVEMSNAINTISNRDAYEKIANGSFDLGKSYDWELIKADYANIVNETIQKYPVNTQIASESLSEPAKAKEKVLIYSIIRNRKSFVATYYRQIKQFVTALSDNYDFYLSIYENDSNDGTPQALMALDWTFVSGVSIISEKLNTEYFGSVKDAVRVENLSHARNKAIEAGGFLDKVDYVLMIEGDVSYDIPSIRKLLSFKEQEPDFDIVSSISLRKNGTHYDWWATRTGPVFDATKSEIEPDYKKKEYGKYYSTSNGLCLYRAKAFQEGARHHWINTVTKEFDCEMVVLCQNFQALGYKNIFINYKARALH